MADKTPVTEDEGWEQVSTDLGTEWDFDKYGDLVGYFLGPKEIDLPEKSRRDGRTKATIWEFALVDSGEQVFLWDSHQLATAMTEPGMGDLVKVQFGGYRKFDSSEGPRQVKQYKVLLKRGN